MEKKKTMEATNMEKLLTPEELSAALGVKLSTIYSWTHKKIIPRAAHIRLLRFRELEVLDWLAHKGAGNTAALQKSPAPQKATQKRLTGKRNHSVDAIVAMAKKEVLR